MAAEDPPRLLEELAAASELRGELSRLSGKRPSAESLARIATAVGAGVPDAPPPAPASPEGSAVPATKLALGLGGAVGVAALLVWALNTPGESNARRPPELDAPASAPSSTAAPSPLPAARQSEVGPRAPAGRTTSPGDEPSTPAPPLADDSGHTLEPSLPADSSQPSPAIPTGAPPAPHPPEDPAGAPRSAEPKPARESSTRTIPPSSPLPRSTERDRASETELLRDARLVLDRNPAIALSLSEQHRRDYPNGSFVQERELIAIGALVRLGRSGDAEARAARFRARYPKSPYMARLDQLVPP